MTILKISVKTEQKGTEFKGLWLFKSQKIGFNI
jgi:hypothetical protein